MPKPFTPFEFEPQASEEEIIHKQQILLEETKGIREINISWSKYKTSILEAVLARGDRRLSAVIYDAWKNGCKFDSWDEHYKYDVWCEAFEKNKLDMGFYACRKRSFNEVFPWDSFDYFISKQFLIRENQTAHKAVTTPNCREKCAACGVSKCLGGPCFE